MNNYIIRETTIINEGTNREGSVIIENGIITKIIRNNEEIPYKYEDYAVINGKGLVLLPGIIDDQVHFRDYELSYKGDIQSESKAAVAGGITSYMDMPNTKPQTVTNKLLEEKYELGANHSLQNYSFYMGATNDNIRELEKIQKHKVCGIKVFMGSSTGNMLVDKNESLERIFSIQDIPIATHCEDEALIQKNLQKAKSAYPHLNYPYNIHSKIRSAEACYRSSTRAVKLAAKKGTKLHILHLTTKKECELFEKVRNIEDKKITSEVCIHHLWFNEIDYQTFGTRIKWNPSIKSESDRIGLWEGLMDDSIDIIATDHAPHTIEEKSGNYFEAPSGGPMVQHSLVAMLEFYHQGIISIEKIVEKMCHNPAKIFKIPKRGFIKEGYYADLVLVDLDNQWTVNKNNILYKCQWSPFEYQTFKSKVMYTLVNGHLVFEKGKIHEDRFGQRLNFAR